MKLINPKSITAYINKCYLEYDPEWPVSLPKQKIFGFKYHLERTAGLKLDYTPKVKYGRYGFEVNQIEVVDDNKYTMFLLRYSS